MDQQRLFEQVSVDIRESSQIRIQRRRPLIVRRVQDLEDLRDAPSEVGTVFAGAMFDQVGERIARLEDTGVVGEQAKHEPH